MNKYRFIFVKIINIIHGYLKIFTSATKFIDYSLREYPREYEASASIIF